jgi:hypothetical protein
MGTGAITPPAWRRSAREAPRSCATVAMQFRTEAGQQRDHHEGRLEHKFDSLY